MGADSSKPAHEVSQHVFSSDAPVRFSNELVGSLQNNTHTDSVRSRQQELEYQQRLTAELEKIHEKEAQDLTELSKTLGDDPAKSGDASLSERLSDAASSSSTLVEKQRQKDLSNTSVTREIEALKKKLEARKKLDQVDARVQKTKDEVTACLRTHDRRPLDCWKEVEAFKNEVGRLEKDFVTRTIQ